MFLVTTTTNTQTICSIESWLDACGTRIMRQPEAFLDPQNAPKLLAVIVSSPRTPSWIQGVLLLRGGEGRVGGGDGKGGEGRAGEGRVCLVLKLPLATPLPTVQQVTQHCILLSTGITSYSALQQQPFQFAITSYQQNHDLTVPSMGDRKYI